MCKQKRCEEILACEDLKNVGGVHCFTRWNKKTKKMSGSLPELWSCHNPLLLVLYIRLWMWASGPSWPDCSWLDIVAASIFAMLAAYSGSCVPETTLTCWTLNSLLCPFNMDIYINAPLECGVVRHNWLCEWMNSSFLRGARLQKFCFKKWK